MNDSVPRQPPRFVPTLTEVIEPPAGAGPDGAAGTALSQEQLLERLTQRVMQRVTQGLETRLREAVAQVVLEQTRGIAPLLAAEVEAAVRDLVIQALAAEQPADRAR